MKEIGENMAEVRKRVIEDKYNTNKIKKNMNQKKSNNPSKKKESSSVKRNVNSSEKKSLFVRFRIFCHGVKNEFLKVHWPSKNDMFKYSIATIVFIVFCSGFFFAIDIIFAFIQSLFS